MLCLISFFDKESIRRFYGRLFEGFGWFELTSSGSMQSKKNRLPCGASDEPFGSRCCLII